VGGPGTPPFCRTRKELCTVRELGSVTLKRIGFFFFQLNTQHTHRGGVNGHIYFASVRTRYDCLIGRGRFGFLFGLVPTKPIGGISERISELTEIDLYFKFRITADVF